MRLGVVVVKAAVGRIQTIMNRLLNNVRECGNIEVELTIPRVTIRKILRKKNGVENDLS